MFAAVKVPGEVGMYLFHQLLISGTVGNIDLFPKIISCNCVLEIQERVRRKVDIV